LARFPSERCRRARPRQAMNSIMSQPRNPPMFPTVDTPDEAGSTRRITVRSREHLRSYYGRGRRRRPRVDHHRYEAPLRVDVQWQWALEVERESAAEPRDMWRTCPNPLLTRRRRAF
jgi:hypothetical protein